MKKCFIHIGTHKTGTTSIQSFLYQNSDILNQKNIFYPPLVDETVNAGHHSTAAMIAAINRENELKISEFIEVINSSPNDIVIVSSEIFSTIDPHLVQRTFAEFDCQIICSLRRQDDYLESMYREVVKNSEFLESKQKFLDLVYTETGLELCAYQNKYNALLPFYYDRFLDKWADCFGKEKIHVYAYDEPKTNGDAVEAFLQAINLSPADFPDFKPESYNKSFQVELLQIRQIIDRKLSFTAQSSLRGSFWWANNHFQNPQPTNFYGTEERQQIMAIVAESNLRLSQTYLANSQAPWLQNPTIKEIIAPPDLDFATALQAMSLLIAHQADRLDVQAQQIAKLQQEIDRLRSNFDKV
jgi:hypothetical protein